MDWSICRGELEVGALLMKLFLFTVSDPLYYSLFFDLLNYTVSLKVLTGEDPRTIMLPKNKLLAVFTDGYTTHGHNGGGTPRLGIALLSINETSGRPEFSRRHQLRMKDKPHEGHTSYYVYMYMFMYVYMYYIV